MSHSENSGERPGAAGAGAGVPAAAELVADDADVTAVNDSVSVELFRIAAGRAAGRSRGQLADADTWLLSLAVGGALENYAFEALASFAREVGRRRCDDALDLAQLIGASDYEPLRARTHPAAAGRAELDEAFAMRLRNLYARTVKLSRQR